MLGRLPEVEWTLNTMERKMWSLTRNSNGAGAASLYLYLSTFSALLLRHLLFNGRS